MAIVICSRRNVESRGCGNDARRETEVGFVELMWWNEGMMFVRRILVMLVMYVWLSFDICCDLGGNLE